MAIRYAIANGNWSDTAIWDTVNGTGVPSISDDVYSNGKTVTIDIPIEVLSLRNTAEGSIISGGVFNVGVNAANIKADIYCSNTITINYNFTNSNTYSFQGNIHGGSNYALMINGNGSFTLNITGNIHIDGTYPVLRDTSSANIIFNGDVYSYNKNIYAIDCYSSSHFTINSNILFGYYANLNTVVTINANEISKVYISGNTTLTLNVSKIKSQSYCGGLAYSNAKPININVDEIVSSSFNALSISYSNNINITANKLIIGGATNITIENNCSGPVNITYNELIYNSPGAIFYLQGSGDVVINGNIYQTQNYDNISLVQIHKTSGNVVINGNVSPGDCYNSYAIGVGSCSSLIINGAATPSNHLSKTAHAVFLTSAIGLYIETIIGNNYGAGSNQLSYVINSNVIHSCRVKNIVVGPGGAFPVNIIITRLFIENLSNNYISIRDNVNSTQYNISNVVNEDQPQPSDVRYLVNYANNLVGECRIPQKENVLYDIDVDNTKGELIINQETLFGQNLLQRLNNSITSDILANFLLHLCNRKII